MLDELKPKRFYRLDEGPTKPNSSAGKAVTNSNMFYDRIYPATLLQYVGLSIPRSNATDLRQEEAQEPGCSGF